MKKRAILLILNLMVGMLVWGQARVPARKGIFAVVQPNGDSLHIELVGDEVWHAHYTKDGYLITQGEDGWWRYAHYTDETYTDRRGHERQKIVATKKKAEDPEKRCGCRKRWLTKHIPNRKQNAQLAPPRNGGMPMIDEQYNTEIITKRMQTPTGKGAHRIVGERTLFPRVLVIMANFSNYNFVSTNADVDSMFNAQHWTKDGATGSIRQYFYDQSNGAYNPQFDVVGPVTLSQGYAYYGAGQSSSARPGYMVTEACALVNDQVNFADYDTDGDGYVDMVFVLYAGFGENDPPGEDLIADPTNLVWPHYWTINSAGCGSNPRVFDGKTINSYECANELDGWYSTAAKKAVAGIGVMVHEFCHGLGLPDLYNTQTAGNKMGLWDVMDYGSYNNDMHTPPSMSAYERWWLGWMTPQHLDDAADITLAPLSESQQAAYLTADGSTIDNILNPNPSNFYLVENRQKTGWDIGTPGKGLLLWQIQYNASRWSNNTVNAYNPQGVRVVHADGQPDDGKGRQGDCYPYQTLDSILVAPSYPITNITQNQDGSVSFKVCGGGKPTGLENENDNENRSRKVLHDGKIRITRGNQTYSIMGQIVH